MVLWMLPLLAIAIVGNWLLGAAVGDRSPWAGEPECSSNALRVLEERFARGEIDRDEFEQRRRWLPGRSGRPGSAGASESDQQRR